MVGIYPVTYCYLTSHPKNHGLKQWSMYVAYRSVTSVRLRGDILSLVHSASAKVACRPGLEIVGHLAHSLIWRLALARSSGWTVAWDTCSWWQPVVFPLPRGTGPEFPAWESPKARQRMFSLLGLSFWKHVVLLALQIEAHPDRRKGTEDPPDDEGRCRRSVWPSSECSLHWHLWRASNPGQSKSFSSGNNLKTTERLT